jgi:hypothetical protein
LEGGILKGIIAVGIVLLVIFVVTFFWIGTTEAAMDPAPPFCEHQGYTVTERVNGTQYCDFGDGNMCEIWEFYRGECGEEYNTGNFPCVKEGQTVFLFEECCKGLEPSSHTLCGAVIEGQPHCRQIPNIFERIWEWILCLFGIPS